MTDSMIADAKTIRQRAYELWERDGRPAGRELDYWLMAEGELAPSSATAGPLTPSEAAPADAPADNQPGDDMTASEVPADPVPGSRTAGRVRGRSR